MKIAWPGLRNGCVFPALAFVVAFVGISFTTCGPFRSVTGQGVSAREANARLWNCIVPDDATDVWYRSSYRATQVECTLSVESFQAWSKKMGWQLGPVVEGSPIFYASQRDGYREVRTLTKGFWFNQLHGGDLGFHGRYDSEEHRAYVTYSGG